MRVLVLGAGFGGLEATARLSDSLGDEADITLVDHAEGFTFGFSKIDVMFGDATPDAVVHRYASLTKPGVQFVQSTVRSIDPEDRRVRTDAGDFEADVLIVALGRRPGRRCDTWSGRVGLRVLHASRGGGGT